MHELELRDLKKSFRGKDAVAGIRLTLTRGVYGLLGENGAGKTTLMRMICAILKETSGSITCDGIDIVKMGGRYRKLLGYLPQDFGYYPDYSAERFLRYMAALKALPEEYAENKIAELLQLVNLTEVKQQKLRTFSGGMLKRIGIAQALLNDPEILVLDEPTSGLDPKERVRFRNIISSLSKNRIVILSTHIVSDIEYIADEILMMKQGRMLTKGTAEALAKSLDGMVWECLVSEQEAQLLNESHMISNLKNQENQVMLRIIAEKKPSEQAVPVSYVTLEDTYLYYLGKGEAYAAI